MPRRSTAAPAPAARIEPVRFATYVQALALEIRKARSGERTKYRLMSAGIALLEQTGFRELNIEDVAKAADTAKGTFYIYFKSKDEFLLDLCRRFVEFEQATMPSTRTETTPFGRILAYTKWYERTFALNIGVMRCLIQMGEVSTDMRDLWHERNRLISDRIMTDWWGVHGTDRGAQLPWLALRTIGGMLDQSLFDQHQIQVGPGRKVPDDPALMVELHSLLTYRALYGANPSVEELTQTRDLLGWPAI